jgi:hypothetical protein
VIHLPMPSTCCFLEDYFVSYVDATKSEERHFMHLRFPMR